MRTPPAIFAGSSSFFFLGRSKQLQAIKARSQLILSAHRVHNSMLSPSPSSHSAGTEGNEPESEPAGKHSKSLASKIAHVPQCSPMA